MAKFHQFHKKLAVKIILRICFVILPIIALILFITNLMISNLEEEILRSYRNELALGMTRVDSQLSIISENINRILSDDWIKLNMGDNSNTVEVEKYEFWKELRNYRANLDMVQFCYIKTNWNNAVSTTYDSASCSYEEAEGIRQFLADTDLTATVKQDYQFLVVDDSEYLIKNISNRTFSFGFILKVDTILSIMQNTQTLEKNSFFISTKNGDIKSIKGNIKIDLNKQIQNVNINGTDSKVILITYPSNKMDYVLVRMIPVKEFNSQIPLLEKLLQVIAFLSIVIIPIIYYLIKRLVLAPLFRLDKAMQQIENENLDYRIEREEHTEEFRHMCRVFNRMADQINKLTIETYEKDIEKLQIEATNLRLQVNPHMLLNSLNMIYSLSLSRNYTCIEEYTLCLVEYFRYSLHQNEELVKLSDEMNYVNSYLRIQKIRFPNSFTYVYDIEEELFDELVPPLLIQNFVENSIKYGLKFESEIEIIVIVKREEDKLNISICDTGNGMDEEALESIRKNEPSENKTGKHIGIWNCRRRLKMYYGDEALINISSAKGKGTQVWIQMPISNEGEQ